MGLPARAPLHARLPCTPGSRGCTRRPPSCCLSLPGRGPGLALPTRYLGWAGSVGADESEKTPDKTAATFSVKASAWCLPHLLLPCRL